MLLNYNNVFNRPKKVSQCKNHIVLLFFKQNLIIYFLFSFWGEM